ncbi:MAG: creatininase family protein [Candidatus Latescibacterota bacterium]|nr:creatininase family protein [Candidatus Latescibacterota bacterium]
MSDDTKVYLPEMSFAEVEDILSDVELAILPTGSNEGHGPHLPLKVDAATSTYVSVEAAKRLYPRVLVAPCLAAGHSPQHLEFPGSISLRVETQIRILTDYTRSLMNYDIRRFAIVNGHGNNMAVNDQAARRITEDVGEGVRVSSFAYWEAIDRAAIAEINDGRHFPGHADEFETSMILHICPEHTRMDRLHEIEEHYGLHGPGPIIPPGYEFLATTTYLQTGLRERLLCDVADENYKLASAEKGAKFAELAVAGTTKYLQNFIENVPID